MIIQFWGPLDCFLLFSVVKLCIGWNFNKKTAKTYRGKLKSSIYIYPNYQKQWTFFEAITYRVSFTSHSIRWSCTNSILNIFCSEIIPMILFWFVESSWWKLKFISWGFLPFFFKKKSIKKTAVYSFFPPPRCCLRKKEEICNKKVAKNLGRRHIKWYLGSR